MAHPLAHPPRTRRACARREVWDALPASFVGMPCQLLPLMQLMCEEMELSFLEAGRPVPPWRGCSATLAKWTSDVFVQLDVPLAQPPEPEAASFLQHAAHLCGGGAGPPPASAAAAAPIDTPSGSAEAYASSGGSASECGSGGDGRCGGAALAVPQCLPDRALPPRATSSSEPAASHVGGHGAGPSAHPRRILGLLSSKLAEVQKLESAFKLARPPASKTHQNL